MISMRLAVIDLTRIRVIVGGYYTTKQLGKINNNSVTAERGLICAHPAQPQIASPLLDFQDYTARI